MKFSTKDRYALLLMVELASATPGEYLPLKAVSDNQGISKAGLVESGRGSQGGYRLSRSAAQITAGDILRAVEGEIVPVPCLATSAESCPHRAQCETLGFWEGLNQVINQYIDSATLEKLSSEYLSH